MTFWNEATKDSEPKRNFRFLVELQGLDDTVIWYAKSVVLPSYNITNVAHSFLDNEYYYPGRIQWQESSMVLVDPVTRNATTRTNAMIVESGYKIPGQVPGSDTEAAKTISKSQMKAALGGVIISVLDSEGTIVEKWELKNPILTSAKFGNLDYSNDELKQVELAFRYDWATCADINGNEQFAPTTT